MPRECSLLELGHNGGIKPVGLGAVTWCEAGDEPAVHAVPSANLTPVISHETWSSDGRSLRKCQLRGPSRSNDDPGATDILSAERFELESSVPARRKELNAAE